MRPNPMNNRRGVNLLLLAISIVALMGMAALAIDLAMLQKTRAEAQRAADAAALAGASAFLEDKTRGQESTLAVLRAKTLADTNTMMGTRIDSATEVAVQVLYDSLKVRVTVRRASVPTWFAKVFGRNTFPVGARAAAVAEYSTGTSCVKPIAVPDLWVDAGDANGNNRYDPGETWLYGSLPLPDTYNPAHYAGDGTGTGLGSDLRNTYAYERDWGLQIVLRPTVGTGDPVQPCPGPLSGNKCYSPSFWGLLGAKSASALAKLFQQCGPPVTVGTTYQVSNGWMQSLGTDVENLFNQDAGARWSPTATDSVTGKTGTVAGSSFGNRWRQSARVWTIGIMSPQDVPTVASDNDTKFNNFMQFFFEGCLDGSGNGPLSANCGTHDMLVGRFVGLAKGTLTGPSPGTMVRILRLVE